MQRETQQITLCPRKYISKHCYLYPRETGKGSVGEADTAFHCRLLAPTQMSAGIQRPQRPQRYIHRFTVFFKVKNSAENSEDVKILLPSKTFFFEIFDTYIFVNYLPLLGNVKNGSNSFQFDKLHSFPFILKSDAKICHLFFQSFFSPL